MKSKIGGQAECDDVLGMETQQSFDKQLCIIGELASYIRSIFWLPRVFTRRVFFNWNAKLHVENSSLQLVVKAEQHRHQFP